MAVTQERGTNNRVSEGIMSGRITWTAQERREVASEALRISQTRPSLSMVEAVAEAQSLVIDEPRRREINASSKLERWVPALWAALTEEETSAAPAAPAEPVASATPASAPEPVEVVVTRKEPAQAAQEAQGDAAVRRQVHWSDDEREAVARKAYALMQHWPDLSKTDAFRKAQDVVLPVERRRDISGFSLLEKWAEPLLQKCALDEQIEAARKREEREQAERVEAERVALLAREQENEAEAERDFERRVEAEVAARIEQMPYEGVIRAFAAKVAKDMAGALRAELESNFRQMIVGEMMRFAPGRNEISVPRPPESRAPRVCVAGLLSQQEQDVARAFDGSINFVFVKSQKTGGNGVHGAQGLLARSRGCDLIVNMCDFMGHDMDVAAKKTGIPFQRLQGNVSSLKRWLTDWLAGDVRAATH